MKYNKGTFENAAALDTRSAETKFMCIPGIKPVIIPAEIPIRIANNISININTDYFTDLYVTYNIIRKFFSFVVAYFLLIRVRNYNLLLN